ncbi:type VI secretion system Vgr family protein [Desulfosarcina ovata]|uniref:Uncharacterized protein n=2 Tax=Desulfosarcina ovata TaxID=83564 RepID=A0A5K8A7Z0_9BACT|nr:type VI secretion system tip protein VgrG [Desulfosarcina ovata]BBO81504.1 hypothetical protein DSCO28_20700 [Desulfosarcina ovata subsp. sediminis]BBO88763.1 hypothetical protein DSCOOX_19430 [Desulfosarcina ovata subsp. ovata]
MTSPIDQSNRFLTIKTPLAPDSLALIRIRGTETLSDGFRYDLDFFSQEANLSFSDMVGGHITVSMHMHNEEIRYINGIVAEFEQGHREDETEKGIGQHTVYHATIVPWSWLLSKMTNNRIFQDKNVKEIIDLVFEERVESQYEWALDKEYEKRTYCVQYNETDLNFVSRLMEEEGISYYFRHEDGQHTMVLTDSSNKLKPCPGQESARFESKAVEAEEDYFIRQLTCACKIIPTRYTHTDYNFETPTTPLIMETDTTQSGNDTRMQREVYDYPGKYGNNKDGERYGRIRMEAEEVEITTLKGKSECIGFRSGYHFKLENYGRDELNDKEYLLVSVTHEASQGWEVFGTPQVDHYTNTFSCIPFETSFRPRCRSFRPKIHGVQTAMVVGPESEEIYTDKYGRVKVQFHWDREGENNENSSCWMRVAQMISGAGWGGMFIPRVGQEVIVEFLEGDPDRPIITGCVYHEHNMPPYSLPDEKTKSTFKSNSSPDGGGFNEIRFEDKKGEEQLFVHAEKNQDIRVKNDCFEWIGRDRHLIVKRYQKEEVENNRHEKVGADHFEEIGKDRHLKVKGKEAKGVDGSCSLTVKGDMIEVFKANHSEQVTNDYYVKGDNLVIEGMTNVTIKVGGSYIAMDNTGIKISGTQVVIDGKMAEVSGSAMVTIKGGMVKIN